MDREKLIQVFYNNLLLSYNNFLLWKNLQKIEYRIQIDKNIIFWNNVTKSLFLTSLSGLAKLYERNDKNDEVVSIYALFEHELSDLDIAIKKIRKLRNKILMHNDYKTAINIVSFMNDLNITYEEIEKMFERLINELTRFAPNHIFLWEKDECENAIEKLGLK